MMVWSLFIIGHMGLFFYTKIGSIISIGDLPTTNIIETVIWCEIFLLSKVSEPSVFEQGDFFSTLIEGIEELKRDGL